MIVKKNLMIMLTISFGELGLAYVLIVLGLFVQAMFAPAIFIGQFSFTLSDLLLAVVVFDLMQ